MTSSDSSLGDGPMQNLPLSISIMILSGALRVSATMALAYPEYQAQRNGELLQAHRKMLLIAVHIFLLTGAAGLGILGTIYGPVAIAVPVQTGSQLILNILAMGLVLKMRSFDKLQRTATYIVILSVLLFVDVGPGPQHEQNIPRLLSSPAAIFWIFLVNVGLVLASIKAIQIFQIRKVRLANEERDHDYTFEDRGGDPTIMFLILLAGVTLSNVAMATTGKCLGFLQGRAFVVAAIYYIISALLGLLFSITSSTFCDQSLFTPACAAALIVVNLFTGVIIWEDWRVVHAWVGYICALLIMCCGVYLLADIDLLKSYFDARTSSTNDSSHRSPAMVLGRAPTEGSPWSLPSMASDERAATYRLLQQDDTSTASTSRSLASSDAI